MKRIDAVIPTERLGTVNDALRKVGIGGLTVYDSKGRGQMPIEKRTTGRGSMVYTPEFNTNSCIMVMVKDSDAEKTVQAIVNSVSSGTAGEGKIFISNVEQITDIGSKKTGEGAL